jgi:transposase InsO family protein
MPFAEVSRMESREVFVQLATQEGANIRALCRQFTISPTTAYAWLARYAEEGTAGLTEHSRRPHTSPRQTPPELEAVVVALREQQPTWGGRKLHRALRDQGVGDVPSPATCTAILRRHGLLDPEEAVKHRPVQRFESGAPNALWQIDFKGDVVLPGQRVYPLQVLDDHSRFLLGVQVCADQRGTTVQTVLTALFRTYGLPGRMLADNGSPWGTTQAEGHLTRVSAWLVRLGIVISHGRPYHPQTQGKIERAMRTLQADVLRGHRYADAAAVQAACDAWRQTYNTWRPHEALELATPASRYQPSSVPFPETLPPLLYLPHDVVRRVSQPGCISFEGTTWRVSKALIGESVALRPTDTDGIFSVFYAHHRVRTLNLHHPPDEE